MKKQLLLILLVVVSLGAQSQIVPIPDANFKAYLLSSAVNSNADGEIQISEASSYTAGINCSGQAILDLTGIEYFSQLTVLQAYSNYLTSIDLSNNYNLTQLLIENNDIEGGLDLSHMTALTDFKGNSNNLTNINIATGNNTNMTRFESYGNPILDCIQTDAGFTLNGNWNIGDASASDACNYFVGTVYIPNATLKGYLVYQSDINTNQDNEIQISEADAYSGDIYLGNAGINDFTGIEAFTSLNYLDCSNNQLSSLDVSPNTALYRLDCDENQLTSLDISANTNLGILICGDNLLTSLDVSANVNMQSLSFDENQITEIDLSSNTILSGLFSQDNPLGSLDLSANPAMGYLYCGNNGLTSLDLSNNPNLITLECPGNMLTDIDISNHPSINQLRCEDNQLTSLNAANGNNDNFTSFNASGNTGLSCIQIDPGFTAPSWWQDNNGQTYSEDCSLLCTVYIPDANFRNYLINDFDINSNFDNEIQCAEANAFSGQLVLVNSNISDLTGIEEFTSLNSLQCQNNQLTSLDLSSNVALTVVRCYLNQISDLNVSNCIELITLECHDNELTTLDITNNTMLNELRCSNNSIGGLDLSMNTNLDYVLCTDNDLTALDASNNVILTRLEVQNNSLTSLNVANGNNSNVLNNSFKTTGNTSLTCIQVDDEAYSTSTWTNIDTESSFSTNCQSCLVNIPDLNFKTLLIGDLAINTNGDGEIQCDEAAAYDGLINAQGASISDLTGIESFPLLTGLQCNNNQFVSLDVSNNTALTVLECQANSLTSLDVSNNTQLTRLIAFLNGLTTIDVSSNTALETLSLGYNELTTIDLTSNTEVVTLYLEENLLTSLDVSNQQNTLDLISCNNNQLTSLDLSSNAMLTSISCWGNPLTSLNVANGANSNIGTSGFVANGMPSLTCIQVDDVAFSTANWTWIDPQASFSTDCGIIADTEAPIALCQNINSELDASGNISITPDQIDNGSTDNVGIVYSELNFSDFNCSSIGLINEVSLVVEDEVGNVGTCTAIVTVLDLIPPTINCPADISVEINSGEMYEIPNYHYTKQASSSDNCSRTVEQTPAPETMVGSGVHEITIETIDPSGNSTTCTFNVNVSILVGVENLESLTSIKIYPNPAENVLSVSGDTKILAFKLYSVLGQELKSVQGTEMDITALPSGLYMVHVETEIGSFSRQVIKK